MSCLDIASIRALFVDPALTLSGWTLHDLDQYDWMVEVDDKVRVVKAGAFDGLVEYQKTDPPAGTLHDEGDCYTGHALQAFFAVRVEGSGGLVGHFLNEDGQWSLGVLVPDLRIMAEAEQRRLQWLNQRRNRTTQPPTEVEEVEFDCCIQSNGTDDDVSFSVIGFPLGQIVGFPEGGVRAYSNGPTRGIPADVQKALDTALDTDECREAMSRPYQRDPQPRTQYTPPTAPPADPIEFDTAEIRLLAERTFGSRVAARLKFDPSHEPEEEGAEPGCWEVGGYSIERHRGPQPQRVLEYVLFTTLSTAGSREEPPDYETVLVGRGTLVELFTLIHQEHLSNALQTMHEGWAHQAILASLEEPQDED